CLWNGCSAEFSGVEALQEHVKVVHVGPMKKDEFYCGWKGCRRAGKGFLQRQKILRHVQVHTGWKPYQCTVCGRWFPEMGVLTTHLRTHTGDKPYACPHPGCTRSFAAPNALAVHLRTHTGEKPFQCPWEGCHRRFADSSNMAKHYRTHSGGKLWTCHSSHGCGMSFSRSDELVRH
ncbi:MAG: hypothetical protein DHS80DRAFT_4546, partial [Piptocephalis tieghemiana]